MKKITAILLSICILTSLMFESSAISVTDNDIINNYELSIIRTQGKVFKKSNSEIAKAMLKKVGMSEKEMALLTESNCDDIVNSESITKYTEYCKVSVDGTEEIITKEKYYELIDKIEKAKNETSSKSVEEHSYSGSDSYFIKSLYVYKTLNAPSGTYGILGSFDWKNFALAYRGKDVLSLSGDGLVFNKSTFSLVAQFNVEEIRNQNLTHITYTDDISNSNNPNSITLFTNAIACNYNLPHNISQTNYSYTYADAVFLITCSSRLQYYSQSSTFNVFCNYFHQRIILTGGFSVNANGASVSVSPSLSYWNKQIATSSPIVYNP